MKASDSIKPTQNGFDVSNHKFMNQLATGLQSRVEETVPDLTMVPTGKTASKGIVSFTLVGQVTLSDADAKDSVNDKVRQLMDTLKNPSNLLSLLQ